MHSRERVDVENVILFYLFFILLLYVFIFAIKIHDIFKVKKMAAHRIDSSV